MSQEQSKYDLKLKWCHPEFLTWLKIMCGQPKPDKIDGKPNTANDLCFSGTEVFQDHDSIVTDPTTGVLGIYWGIVNPNLLLDNIRGYRIFQDYVYFVDVTYHILIKPEILDSVAFEQFWVSLIAGEILKSDMNHRKPNTGEIKRISSLPQQKAMQILVEAIQKDAIRIMTKMGGCYLIMINEDYCGVVESQVAVYQALFLYNTKVKDIGLAYLELYTHDDLDEKETFQFLMETLHLPLSSKDANDAGNDTPI